MQNTVDLVQYVQPAFVGFRKIPRLSRDIIISEKIDGTNAQVVIGEDGSFHVASKNRWIAPSDDNFGFAKWAAGHRDELMLLGPGQHFGEWWGQGIQRGYDQPVKRFSLFNTSRWVKPRGDGSTPALEGQGSCPGCCDVVPVLYVGPFDTNNISNVLWRLREQGSVAAPGWKKPEGIVIFHTALNGYFKKTLEGDDKPKGVEAC